MTFPKLSKKSIGQCPNPPSFGTLYWQYRSKCINFNRKLHPL